VNIWARGLFFPPVRFEQEEKDKVAVGRGWLAWAVRLSRMRACGRVRG